MEPLKYKVALVLGGHRRFFGRVTLFVFGVSRTRSIIPKENPVDPEILGARIGSQVFPFPFYAIIFKSSRARLLVPLAPFG